MIEVKDGSVGFEFGGTYTDVIRNKHIAYKLDDGKNVDITFTKLEKGILITENFEPEAQNSIDIQKRGWQLYWIT